MQHNPVGWFEIYVQDMARARRFYETVLQQQLSALDFPGMEMWTFPTLPDAKGCSGALVQMDGVAGGGNSVMVYFSCADCAQEAGRVAAAGGQLQQPKTAIGEYGFIAVAIDSEGNTFGLHSLQ